LLAVRDVSIAFGGVVALHRVSFDVKPGGICGLIGPNGAGKTTLFNCVSRLYTPQSGSIEFDGTDLLRRAPHEIAALGIARTFQNLGLVQSLTVRENVMLGAHHRLRAGFVSAAIARPAVRSEERALGIEADGILARLGLDDVAEQRAGDLPFGTLKRVELARALCLRPRLLMLDEPASGLNHEEVSALGDLLLELREEFDLTVLLVEHHMGLVMRTCDDVVVLHLGELLAHGAPSDIRADERVVEAYLGTTA
jgi:branched-chain amino acid transport system ATP-binding protein